MRSRHHGTIDVKTATGSAKRVQTVMSSAEPQHSHSNECLHVHTCVRSWPTPDTRKFALATAMTRKSTAFVSEDTVPRVLLLAAR